MKSLIKQPGESKPQHLTNAFSEPPKTKKQDAKKTKVTTIQIAANTRDEFNNIKRIKAFQTQDDFMVELLRVYKAKMSEEEKAHLEMLQNLNK